ncbi:MAG: hypothetical protein WCT28_03005 [Patescibacteria group bacterium]|jgi:hypothetical protein
MNKFSLLPPAVAVVTVGVIAGIYFGTKTMNDSYRKVHIWGPVVAEMSPMVVDGAAVICIAQGEYDINIWFPGDKNALNGDGAFESVKEDARVIVTGYDCKAFGGAKDLCVESLADGPQSLSFSLKDDVEYVYLLPGGGVGDSTPDRLGFSAKQPSVSSDILIHSVCSSGESDTSDHGTSYDQLVFPLTNPAFSLMVGFDEPTDHFSFINRPSVGKVVANMDLYVQESLVKSLDE